MGPLNVSRPLIAGHFHLLQNTAVSFLSPTNRGLDDPLQHPASVDQDMRLVLNHIVRILAPLDPHAPLLLFLIPRRADDRVAQPHVLQQPVILRDLLEVR